ncbi:MAG: MFS transporter [Clostridia bacterium]|nr:MFS transporter [Clostridia bacterium]
MKINRYLRLFAAALVLFFAGVVYAWSILKAPLGEEFGWTPAALALNFTITMCSFATGGLVSGLLAKKVPAQLRIAIGGLLGGIGILAVSFLPGDTILPLYLLYGVLAGFSNGVVYNTGITTPNGWFPDKSSFSSGVVMMAFGFSTLVLGKILQAMFDSPSFGWRKSYLFLGLALILVSFLTAPLVRTPKPGEVPPAAAKKAPVGESIHPLGMLKRFSFYALFFVCTFQAAVGNTMISFAKDFSLSLDASASLAVTLVGLLSVCNGFGRLISGALLDKLGLRKTQYIIVAILMSAALVGLAGVLVHSLALGICSLVLCGFSYGFCPTFSAAATLQFYGAAHYPLNLSIVNLTLIPTSFMATLAGGLVESSGGYLGVFLVLTLAALAASAVNLCLKKA